MAEKVINFYKEDYPKEQWNIICNEFEVDSETESITTVIDTSSVSEC